jgi:hypothetical protein
MLASVPRNVACSDVVTSARRAWLQAQCSRLHIFVNHSMEHEEDHMSRPSVRAFMRLLLLAALVASSVVPVGGSDHAQSLADSPETAQQQVVATEAPSAAPAPLMFIQNAGQYPDNVLFQVWGGGESVWLAQDGLWLSVAAPDEAAASSIAVQNGGSPAAARAQPTQHVDLKLSFAGAGKPVVEPFGRLHTHVAYYVGNDARTWRADVPVWSGVRYQGLYPGLDLEMSGADGHWTWQVQAQPGADLNALRLRVQGAQKVTLTANAVRLSTELGDVLLPLIVAPQNEDSLLAQKLPAPTVVDHDVIAPLTTVGDGATLEGAADLIEVWLVGGSASDGGSDVALGGSDVYYTGSTSSTDWPTAWGQVAHGGDDIYVLRCGGVGCVVSYLTFLGGTGRDLSQGIAVDGSGNAYVTGSTLSPNFPLTPNSLDATCGKHGTCYLASDSPEQGYKSDAFVVKLDGSGHLGYGTYLGGEAEDVGSAIAVNSGGEVFIAG